MEKKIIIAQVQAGNHNFATEENIFVPMTAAQHQARKDSYNAQRREHWDNLGKRARMKS